MNTVSASYFVLRFSGRSDDVNNINKYSISLKKTSNALVNLSNILVQTKDNNALSTSFLKSVTDSNSLNQISDPPYGEPGQIYWDSTNQTLISTDGTNRYIWVGSSWISINSNNLITGTKKNVSQLIALSPGKIPTKDLQINSSGQITTTVQISEVTASSTFIFFNPYIKVKLPTTTISNISWDPTHHCLTGTTSSGLQVIYSVYPDKYGSYWSDAILKAEMN
ncbi:hypothetical protein [Limosilactobacillus fermentum]|uniref:hypothetical protein n=1 Tax=Limosilactobacillus fermentum TaxID=1613 RepID=UPI00128C9C26|nr:hypothetical protein [Limosilactobacillus fermentum]MPW03902.1 hypothetical protein [Limosilactobacillus fermentum]